MNRRGGGDRPTLANAGRCGDWLLLLLLFSTVTASGADEVIAVLIALGDDRCGRREG